MTNLPFRSILNQPLPPIPPSTETDGNLWKPPPPSVAHGNPPRIPAPLTAKPSGRTVSVDDAEDENMHSIRQTKPRSRTLGETSATTLLPPSHLDDDDYEKTDLPPPRASPTPSSPLHRRKMPAENHRSSSIPERNEEVSLAEISTLKASMKFLQSLVEATQENSQKELKSLREEVSTLTASVKLLTERNQQLHAKVETLSKKVSSNPGMSKSFAPWIETTYGGVHTTAANVVISALCQSMLM